MSRIFVARRQNRRGLLLTQAQTGTNTSLLFPLDGVDPSEMDELIRGILAKQGVSDEPTIQAIIADAELQSEARQKVFEAKKELRRLMALRAQGHKLMQRGFRRWAPAFYRAIAAKE